MRAIAFPNRLSIYACPSYPFGYCESLEVALAPHRGIRKSEKEGRLGANTSQQQDWNIRPHLTEAWQAASPRSSLPQADTSKLGLQRCHSDLGNRGRWPIVMKPVLLDCTKGINSACFAKADNL